MECLQKAMEAKETAEKKMLVDDFQGGRISALEANKLFPQLENISQVLAVCDVHCAAQKIICGSEKDWYEILQVERQADDATIKKQYRKLALLLHPDKNKFPGAEAAFKLIGEAKMVLSDKVRRGSFDIKHRAYVTAAIPKAPPRKRKTNSVVKKAEEVINKKPNVSSYQFSKNYSEPTIPNMFSRGARTFFCHLCARWYPKNPTVRIASCPNCFKENVFDPQGAPPGSKQHNVRPQGGARTIFCHLCTRWYPKNPLVRIASCPNCFQENVFDRQGAPPVSKQHDVRPQGVNAVPQQTQVPGQAFKVDVQYTGKIPSSQPGKKFGSEHVKQTGVKVGAQNTKFTNTHLGDETKFVPCFGTDQIKHTFGTNEINGSVKSKAEEVSSKATMSNAESTRKSSRQRKNVSYNESIGNDDDFISSPAVVVEEYPDPEFNDFDKIRSQNSVAVNQIWACYDTVDGMPRFYAKIKKVHLLKSKLCIAWLEADPEKQEEIDWVNEDLPVSCGKFMCVDTEETIDYHTLSHLVDFEKGNNKDTYIVYPKKGETWALFMDWDIGWSSEPDIHRKNKLEIVEILSDFCLNTGTVVGYLGKVKGFISLYQRKSVGAASVLIPSSEILRFSHQISSFKMTGSEGVGVPQGSFELDPAALPVDPKGL